MEITSKQRAYLKSLAMTQKSLFDIGKDGLTPEITHAVEEALDARELIKLSVLKNCEELPLDLGQMLAERTHSVLVQVIGRKIVLYKVAKDPKKRNIELPKGKPEK